MIQISAIDTLPAYVIAIVLFILVLASFFAGVRIRRNTLRKNPELSKDDFGSISSSLLGLLALLLAFTFGMANSRFDDRRNLAIQEANAIGTAVLRADVFPDSMKNILKKQFEEYLEARIAFNQSGMDVDKMVEYYYKADGISAKIWMSVSDYAKKNPESTRTSEIIPAINEMIDITTSRRAAGEANIPSSIQLLLITLCVCSTFLMGYERKNKFDVLVIIGFSLMLAFTVFTIIDMDRPRSGLVTMDEANSKIVDLRSLFKK
ncbi:MAG: hypothetical protein PSV36_02605 [Algoriphagus sp.]|nr:hypothetical protein [Algoriphagus sp.]